MITVHYSRVTEVDETAAAALGAEFLEWLEAKGFSLQAGEDARRNFSAPASELSYVELAGFWVESMEDKQIHHRLG